MRLILNGYRHAALWTSRPPLRFVFVRFDKERSLPYKMYARGELLVRILDAAAHIKKRKDQLATNNTRSSYKICNVH